MEVKATATQTEFRNAMANLCSAVSIITSEGSAGKIGITVSSVCSVTDSPPTLLFCVNQSSELHNVIQENEKVCVNVLNSEQAETAKHFAGMKNNGMDERFGADEWLNIPNFTQPVLKNAVSSLQGKIIDSHTVGSHSIFVVELEHIYMPDTTQNALVYFNRNFREVK